MIQIKEYDENAFKGYQIKLKDGRFPSNDKTIIISPGYNYDFSSPYFEVKCTV